MTNKKLVSIITSKIILEEITLSELGKMVEEELEKEKKVIHSSSIKNIKDTSKSCLSKYN